MNNSLRSRPGERAKGDGDRLARWGCHGMDCDRARNVCLPCCHPHKWMSYDARFPRSGPQQMPACEQYVRAFFVVTSLHIGLGIWLG